MEPRHQDDIPRMDRGQNLTRWASGLMWPGVDWVSPGSSDGGLS